MTAGRAGSEGTATAKRAAKTPPRRRDHGTLVSLVLMRENELRHVRKLCEPPQQPVSGESLSLSLIAPLGHRKRGPNLPVRCQIVLSSASVRAATPFQELLAPVVDAGPSR
jgi:hypothetical protein